MKYVVDINGFCDDSIFILEKLKEVKGREEGFKVTLFTIPGRTGVRTIKKVQELNNKGGEKWIRLAPLGFFYSKGECLSWGEDTTVERVIEAEKRGVGDKVFKAPYYLCDAEVYNGLEKLGYGLYVEKDVRIPMENRERSPKEFVVDAEEGVSYMTSSLLVREVADGLSKDALSMFNLGNYDFPKGTEFLFVSDLLKEEGE